MINSSQNNKEYLCKLHSELLAIMDEIHNICINNSVRYYLVGGSLLGAIRHKGFIPWDDDLDIAMPREDMEKFFRIIQTKMSESFYLKWITTDITHTNIFAKICKRGTLFQECLDKSDIGIFVDIFPLDNCGKYNKSLEFRRTLIRKLNMMSLYKNSSHISIKKVFSSLFSNKFLFKLQKLIMTTSGNSNSKYYSNFGSQYPQKKQTIPKEWYGKGRFLPFEDRCYVVPDNYTEILTSIYGKNYMTIPPKSKQRSHYPLRVMFSDGQIMEFKKEQNRVLISEQ